MKMFKNKKGFTLIEIMIVVIILAIMATLILPRMLSAPESAYLAEANAMLGGLSRAQDTYMQLTGSTASGNTVSACGSGTACAVGSADAATWAKLGMEAPSTQSRYAYNCDSTNCYARRSINGQASSASFNYVLRTFSGCSGSLAAANDKTRGCIIV
ncbi:MAG: type II secretion system protein [Candidatus Omnitrophota bacterium]